jgi:hypothetical protein
VHIEYETNYHTLSLALLLFMLWILANNANNPIPLYNLAFIANGLHAGSDFHSLSPESSL